jgi:hypothetical protein
MSKARAKGTRWETELLAPLRRLYGPQVERAPLKGTQDKGDFVGVPFQHEAKNTQKPLFLQWARTAYKKSTHWVILWSGDRRTVDGGPFVLMPLQTYYALVEAVPAEDRFTIGDPF